MKLIVGLGNYGLKYENTRHNMGFLVLDELAKSLNVSKFKEGFSSLYAKFKIGEEDVILCKPLTYMNNSGFAVRQIVEYYKIDIVDILIISDDMALEPGRIRLRNNGSSGGQKGLQNIIENLQSDGFKRLRVGIGEPESDVVDYVLGKPSFADKEKINEAVDKAVDAIVYYLNYGFEKASSKFNSKI